MKYLKQAFVIFGFSLAGQALQEWIPLPVPAAIYGFVLLFLALSTGLLKEKHIDETATFLISILPILCVAPMVNILSCYQIIAPNLIGIVTIVLVSTVVVFAVAGLVTRALRRKEDREDG